MPSDQKIVYEILNILSPYHRKTAYALSLNVEGLLNRCGIDRVGFLTVTFPDNVCDPKEALRRFNSFNTNFLKKHFYFGLWLYVKERQKRGAWHYHVLIDCGGDIRTGIDWEALERGDYRSANAHLRMLWADLRESLPKYGFGRSELLPIRENAEAMAKYVGKYISKHVGVRRPEDKRVRLVSYSRNWLRSGTKFQWMTPNSRQWRKNLAAFAECYGFRSMDEVKDFFGDRWAYFLAKVLITQNWTDTAEFEKALEGAGFPFGENLKKLQLRSVPESALGDASVDSGTSR